MKFSVKQHTILSGAIALACILPVMAFGQNGQPLVDSNAKVVPFAPGIVDTRNDEEASSFSPDNKTVYFAMGSVYSTICFSTNVDGKWSKPMVASFSGKWSEMDPFISPDGKRLFFSSSHPLPGAPVDKPNKHYELWYVDNTGNGAWSEPKHLDAPINTGNENNVAPCISGQGTLYWCSWDREAGKGMQTYYSAWVNGQYQPAKMLSISGIKQIEDPFIAANEKYILFSDGNDLYISMRNGDDWAAPQKLGPPVSMGDGINSPFVTRDGKTLYFTTGRIDAYYKRDPIHHALNFDELEKENDSLFNGNGNIFTVPVNLPPGD